MQIIKLIVIYLVFKQGDYWGFINTKGEMVIQPQFEDVGFLC